MVAASSLTWANDDKIGQGNDSWRLITETFEEQIILKIAANPLEIRVIPGQITTADLHHD